MSNTLHEGWSHFTSSMGYSKIKMFKQIWRRLSSLSQMHQMSCVARSMLQVQYIPRKSGLVLESGSKFLFIVFYS